MKVSKIAIFASGTGTNAEKIIQHFQKEDKKHIAQVSLVLSNRMLAGVLEKAHQYQIPTCVFDRKGFYESSQITDYLQQQEIDLIVLAGFLWLLPSTLIRQFPDKIINIHPSLLPLFGGKGMYGMYVHEAVKAAGASETGITIHYVNENYDEGKIILQRKCTLSPEDTPEDIAHKVQHLEHHYFPLMVENILTNGANKIEELLITI
ncbi:MAG: phosphoribosylglycinamide formyltransferase [Cytophagales bacterium]|nr:MAG: phosphoribosylglycinamide formyltransferase [Cytophagales bacterium]